MHDPAATLVVERTKFAAPGIAGGEPGGVGFVVINGQDIDNRRPHFVRRGDTILLGTPGGRGYGEPTGRDLVADARDRCDGLLRRVAG